jgi:hypothetical protein
MNFSIIKNKITPIKTSNTSRFLAKNNDIHSIFVKDETKSITPKMPVRLSSSISSLISSSLLTNLPTISKERSLSCSLSQPSNELFHPTNAKWTSLNLGENDEVHKTHKNSIFSFFYLEY